MTPEQRESARTVIFWRFNHPNLDRVAGIQRDCIIGKLAADVYLKILKDRGCTPLYVVRGVEVRWRHRSKTVSVWKDERNGYWHRQDHQPLSGEELAALWRAEG